MSERVIPADRLDCRRLVLTSIRRLPLPNTVVLALEKAEVFLLGDILCLNPSQLRDLVGASMTSQISAILSGKTQIEVAVYSTDPRKSAETVQVQVHVTFRLGMTLEDFEPGLTTQFHNGRRRSIDRSKELPIR